MYKLSGIDFQGFPSTSTKWMLSYGMVMYFICVYQIQEPLLLLGKERFAGVDIRVRVKGGGRVSQIYGMYLLFMCIFTLTE